MINKQANDNTELTSSKVKRETKLNEILERISIGMRKGSNEVHQDMLSLMLEHSRLVFSEFSLKLFNKITTGVSQLPSQN